MLNIVSKLGLYCLVHGYEHDDDYRVCDYCNEHKRSVYYHKQTQTERIFLTNNQLEVLDVIARALDQMMAEYITDSSLSMMECDID